MNVGKAITAAMQEQRRRDITVLDRWCIRHWRGYGLGAHHALQAYWWWGWDINGRSGLGKPGSSL